MMNFSNVSGDMAAFVEVIRQGGFSAAARALGRTPSAVSKQIARLEERLGVRLLYRSTRRLRMTEEGEAYYRRAVAILSDIEEAEAAVTQSRVSPRGVLRVTNSIAFGRNQIVPMLPEFLGAYPDLKLQLSLSDNLVDLVEEGYDVAVRMAELTDSSLVARRLATDHRVVCASPAYIEKFGAPRTPDDLRNHNCLVYFDRRLRNEWELSIDGKLRRFPVNGRFEANSGIAVHEAALSGLGIAYLATFLVAPDVKAGRLVTLLDDYITGGTPIYAVYPHRRHLSPKVRVFIDFLIGKFTPTPPWEA